MGVFLLMLIVNFGFSQEVGLFKEDLDSSNVESRNIPSITNSNLAPVNIELSQPMDLNLHSSEFESGVQLSSDTSAVVKKDTIITKKTRISKHKIYRTESEPRGVMAPTNDLPCNAELLDLSSGTDCFTQVGGNSGATIDYYGGCIQPNHKSVWYKFEITSGNDYLNVTITAPAGKEMEAMIVQGNCTGSPDGYFVGAPTLIESHCALSPFNFEFYNLSPGWYYLMFSTQPGSNQISTDFDICFTQSPAPVFVTGPEQDCFGAIPVCDMTYTQDLSYTGYWLTDEIPNYFTCLTGGENNSVWYVFTPSTTGTFAFTLQTLNDYDWALWDLTAIGGCSNVGTSAPVRCNYSATTGNTGMSAAGVAASVGAGGLPWSTTMTVTAGNTYALLVDNYSSDPNGYVLDFSSSLASIADRPPVTGAFPSMTSASVSCSSNTITITMSEYVKCISIREEDFILTNTTTTTDFSSAILTATGLNCATNELTNQIILTHDGSLTTGQYSITINASPILVDKCDNLINTASVVNFNYLSSLTLTPSASTICSGSSVVLTANGANGLNIYTINPGGLTDPSDPDDGIFPAISPTVTTTYTVSATYGGCTRNASTSVAVQSNILTTVSPVTKTVCSFTPNPTISASTSINGSNCTTCTYSWATVGGNIVSGQGTSTITIDAAGTYTVTATTGIGCVNDNSPSSIISVVSAGTGGGSCDVLYVSPAGGGDGYSKTAPTTLSDAITKAQCTNAIIKMQRGIYTMTNYNVINNFVTIEGGYNSDFSLKYSDMTGGTNSTTIRRTNVADNGGAFGDATKCSAFVAGNGTTDFRIQDIRIEMPGSTNVTGHTAGTGVANYGIRLGSSCASYNIIRCYIDAGIGANP